MKTPGIITFIALLFAFTFSVEKSVAQTTEATQYPIVIKFQSICCGVPSEQPLKNAINGFKKKYKVKKISAVHIGPMGREGEYWLAFPLKELSVKQRATFIKMLVAVTPTLKDTGQADYEEKMQITQAALPGRATQEKVKF